MRAVETSGSLRVERYRATQPAVLTLDDPGDRKKGREVER
jgi:hypothetical protein